MTPTDSEHAKEELVGDRLTKVTELVNKLLEVHVVIVNRHVELLAPKKLVLQEMLGNVAENKKFPTVSPRSIYEFI